MRKVPISADLERRLRAGTDPQKLLKEVVDLLDENVKRAAGSSTGLGYKELVALFRSALGAELALPMSPNAGYIVKIVNKARELGINKDNVDQIARGLRLSRRGPYALGTAVYYADEHFARGDRSKTREPGKVVTGRPRDFEELEIEDPGDEL